MRRPLLLLVAIASFGLAACGGGDDDGSSASRGDARELLQRAFRTPVNSAVLDFDGRLELDGGENGGFRVKLSGPFVSQGERRIPKVDLDVSVESAGQNLTGGVVYTGDNAFVQFGGQAFAVGKDVVGTFNRQIERSVKGAAGRSILGIDAAAWVRDPRVEGEEDVAGTSTTKVSGGVDVLRVVDDIAKLGDELGPMAGADSLKLSDEDRELIGDMIDESRVEVYVAGDGTLRRLALDVGFQVPEDRRADFDGAKGGSAKIDLTFDKVGEEQEIKAPEDAQPLSRLLDLFGLGADDFQLQ